MLKLYVFILWALLPLLTMGKGILIQNVVIFDGKSEKTVTGNVWIEDNAIRKVSAEPIVAGAEVEVIDEQLQPELVTPYNGKYYYVPSLFIDGEKLFEAQPGQDYETIKAAVEKTLKAAAE